jgi:hypothetical protein
MLFVMLLWVYIHTRQAWKICLATVGIKPTNHGVDIHYITPTQKKTFIDVLSLTYLDACLLA